MTTSTGKRRGPLSKEKLDEGYYHRVDAYVRTDGDTDDVLDASKKKRAQRQKMYAAGKRQYVVQVPNDAKKTLKAVADAVVADQKVGPVILSLVSSAALLKLCEVLSASEPEVSSIIELAKRGDLAALAAMNVTNPTLLQAILGLMQSDDESAAALQGILRCVGDPSANPKQVLEAAEVASRNPEAVLRFTNVRQRGGLRARVLDWVLGDAA